MKILFVVLVAISIAFPSSAQNKNTYAGFEYSIPDNWYEIINSKRVTLTPDSNVYRFALSKVNAETMSMSCDQLLLSIVKELPLKSAPVITKITNGDKSFCKGTGVINTATGHYKAGDVVAFYLFQHTGYFIAGAAVAHSKEIHAKYEINAENILKNLTVLPPDTEAYTIKTFTYDNAICNLNADWSVAMDSTHTWLYPPGIADNLPFKILLYQGDSLKTFGSKDFEDTWTWFLKRKGFKGAIPKHAMTVDSRHGAVEFRGEGPITDEDGNGQYIKLIDLNVGHREQIIVIIASDKATFEKFRRQVDQITGTGMKFVSAMEADPAKLTYDTFASAVQYIRPDGWSLGATSDVATFKPDYLLEDEQYLIRVLKPVVSKEMKLSLVKQLYKALYAVEFNDELIVNKNTVIGQMAMTQKDGTELDVIVFLTERNGKILPYIIEYNNTVTFERFESQTKRFIEYLKW
jgi:hypothetical protein